MRNNIGNRAIGSIVGVIFFFIIRMFRGWQNNAIVLLLSLLIVILSSVIFECIGKKSESKALFGDIKFNLNFKVEILKVIALFCTMTVLVLVNILGAPDEIKYIFIKMLIILFVLFVMYMVLWLLIKKYTEKRYK